jgi:hypothetical protein
VELYEREEILAINTELCVGRNGFFDHRQLRLYDKEGPRKTAQIARHHLDRKRLVNHHSLDHLREGQEKIK